nr:MAG TPA: hypothetical protein [Caudoviricetes sp.]
MKTLYFLQKAMYNIPKGVRGQANIYYNINI